MLVRLTGQVVVEMKSSFCVELRSVTTAGSGAFGQKDPLPLLLPLCDLTINAPPRAITATTSAPTTIHTHPGVPDLRGFLRAMPSPVPRRRARFSLVRCFWRWLTGS